MTNSFKILLSTLIFSLLYCGILFAQPDEQQTVDVSITQPNIESSKISITLTQEEKLWIEDHPTITVSNEFDWPPFDFVLSGKPYGFGIDLMNLISEYSGIQFEYINGYTWDQLVEKFYQGEIDLLHSISSTPQREEKSYFSPPYFHSKNVLILRQDTVDTNDLNDLEGKIIALPKGWSSIEFFKTYYPGVHIVEVASSRQAFEYVDQGKVFATVEQKEIAQYFIQKFGFHELKISQWIENTELQKTSSMHFTVLKTNPVLFQILVKAQNNIPPEQLVSLKEKWFSREGRELGREAVGLTPDEKAFLQDKQVIRYCLPPDTMPFSAINNGQVTGMASDLIEIFSEKLNVPFELTLTSSWAESEEKFQQGACDILPMVTKPGTIHKTEDLTSAILTFQSAIITRENSDFIAGLEDFKGKKLAVVKYGMNQDNILGKYPHTILLPLENTQECLVQVSNKTVDGALLALPVAAYYIRHLGLNDLKIAGYTGTEGSIRIGIRKEQVYLHSIMSKLIRSIPQNDIDTVYQKWISLRFEHKVDYKILWKIFAAIAFLVVVILLWNRQLFHLNKKIAEANRQLEEKGAELKKLSITDVLTNLYNRRYADNKLEEEINRISRYNGDLSIILADLDYFKKVNDTWGHQIGDEVLISFARLLTDNTRECDLVSRWGGEEFLIICPETNAQGASVQAEHLRQIYSQLPFDTIDKQTASFGVATLMPGETKTSLIQRADEALYQAKKKGRNRVHTAC
jgi:polar amino acid transport system substrate-binding protein